MNDEEKTRAGELCEDCGTPLEVAQVEEDQEPAHGATLTLRCANGHERVVHRQDEEQGDGARDGSREPG